MPRLLAACLALLLTANGWVALPASYIETGRDSNRSAQISKQIFQRPGISETNPNFSQPAVLSCSNPRITQQKPQPITEKVLEYHSRPVDAPPAYRLGQRPPPQTV